MQQNIHQMCAEKDMFFSPDKIIQHKRVSDQRTPQTDDRIAPEFQIVQRKRKQMNTPDINNVIHNSLCKKKRTAENNRHGTDKHRKKYSIPTRKFHNLFNTNAVLAGR